MELGGLEPQGGCPWISGDYPWIQALLAISVFI
jgi:hypothetical protein